MYSKSKRNCRNTIDGIDGPSAFSCVTAAARRRRIFPQRHLIPPPISSSLCAVLPTRHDFDYESTVASVGGLDQWTFSPSTIVATTTTTVTPDSILSSPSTSFEPILNVPALVTFVFIASIFGALTIRTNQVEAAVQERNKRLQELRECKSQQLENTDAAAAVENQPAATTTIDEDLARCLQRYEEAVQREERLRNVLPGTSRIRIVAPSGIRPEEVQARADARRFLGKDYDIGSTTASSSSPGAPSQQQEPNSILEDENEENNTNNSQLPIWPLAVVILSQLALFAFYTSLEDAATNSPFDTVM